MLSILAAAVLLQAPAAAMPPALKPRVITQPDWRRRPDGKDFANLYPKSASARNVEGQATVACRVNQLGELVECSVTSESPASEGFGEAALAMAAKFNMRPQTKDGLPVAGGTVRIPIKFVLPKPEPLPSAAVALKCYGYAAAQAESNPTSQIAQIRVFAFGTLIQAKLVSENRRPSETAEILASQQGIAASKIRDPNFAAERAECAVALPNSDAARCGCSIGCPRSGRVG